jgi:PhnB protein
MTTRLNPYINFKDNTKDALAFYHSVFGGDLTTSTFGEAGMPVEPGEKDLIMHGQLISPTGLTLMAADTPSHMARTGTGSNIAVSLSGEDEDELTGYWTKLSEGASITVPLAKAPWGDTFGMLTDKFGTDWLVNITGSPAQ